MLGTVVHTTVIHTGNTQIPELCFTYDDELICIIAEKKKLFFSQKSYHTITLNGGKHLVKCFGLEITDGEVFHLAILMKRDIFSDRIRPSNRGFEVIFHYPNQALNAIHTLLNQWERRDKTTNYWIEFNVRGFEVDIHRYKSRLNNCVRDWKNYDYLMVEEDIKSVGCKAAYHPKKFKWPVILRKNG